MLSAPRRALRAIVPDVDLTHRWSGQVIETPDGLPYIGQSADHQYSATGYAGNGLTFGTLAGIMISDAILGRSNPWSRAVRSGSEGADAWPVGLRQGERRLSVLPDSRSVCRSRGEIPSCGEARSGKDHRTKWREGRGVSRHGRHGHAALGHLHAHGMHGRLEHGRAYMGLPVSWVALQADRRRDLRAGRGATARSGVRCRRLSALQRRLRVGQPLWLPDTARARHTISGADGSSTILPSLWSVAV